MSERREALLNEDLQKRNHYRLLGFFILGATILVILFFASILVGTRYYGFAESFAALFGNGERVVVRVIQNVRLPRTIAAILIGGALSLSGLMMQTCLKNPLASPSTMGVSSAATLGANIAILFVGSGVGATSFSVVAASPYAVSGFALLFALIAMGIVLLLSSFKKFTPTSVLLVGVAMGTFFQALVTLIQFFADDVQLSNIVSWTFGDLERMTMGQNTIMGVVLLVCLIVFYLLGYRYNALSSGEDYAKSLGVRTNLLRFIGLFLASLLCAVAVSFVGIIGFLGVIAPHIAKRILGPNHFISIPASTLLGALLLLFFDIITRLIGSGVALPVGAITAIVGAPLFIALLFIGKGVKK